MQQASIAEDDMASAKLVRLDALQHEKVQLEEEMHSRLMLQLASAEQQLDNTQETLTVQQVSVAPKASLTVICSSGQNDCVKDKCFFIQCVKRF